ncbi:MAG: sulfate ABC transporter permease subunit CysW [Chelatococcus sp.]|uniref:sulfate ABC transporter permease subunit CysW n=1 Tax=unclassified Chelatococcus TaxID=2638111 RepID=UPI001BCD9191|nr:MULTISPECIES: sulfate ABC transporter permease subunit CysW [unclassified Chelatococcus]MBS7740062.1 sulfate ABC transporter permease subunit CysW [Chelatococcus sp. HY11]MBX3537774.1 sulfate ABC transporter permease subunit CysW [Chelatococcus sp.]MBX3545109.1 sulfate ABC transporter permease subunit CysW [Chelatococcus sp.]MCO5078637.1 sulfate ABC transporter permease subunit CysW [Chelatococcus sp.]
MLALEAPRAFPQATAVGANARPTRSGQRLLIATGLVLTALFLVAPVAVIFSQAFARGFAAYRSSILQPETLHAIWLTAVTAVIAVPINMVFGVAAAWAIAKFRFPGKKTLISLIEIPFSISPIVAGVAYLLVYGSQGLFGEWLADHDIRIMFTPAAIVLVMLFVTSPFVVRELLPLMQAQGSEQEEAAATLGATGFQIFRRVTLPNIRWALLYGTVLCSARAIGEFGAVSVVSGRIRGETNTLPLQIELLYNDYNAAGAFAAASTLTVIALITLLIKAVIERRIGHA